ncbi:hypothetical protein ACFWJ4_37440 [Kitasatospora sp. NPDC127067]|uniref:hypothetical protein n=1 Tax=Kitasatospora sp. NPDC127067 TaxID=3347126 RepID=UPI0036506413
MDAALDTQLAALGTGREALAFTGSVEGGLEKCNCWPGQGAGPGPSPAVLTAIAVTDDERAAESTTGKPPSTGY